MRMFFICQATHAYVFGLLSLTQVKLSKRYPFEL